MKHRYWLAWLLFSGCKPPGSEEPPAELVHYTEERSPCADQTALRRPLFGDLHVHGALSFDAVNYQTTATPAEVLAFAKGEPVLLAPLGLDGKGTRSAQLDRPLDFAAVTEHAEFLGEVSHCSTPGAMGYDASICAAYQGGDDSGAFDFGLRLAAEDPTRHPELCGEDGRGCDLAAAARWQEMQDATEQAYDRSEKCTFTALVGYEYTNTYQVSNLHRNVIFRNAEVPPLPPTTFEAKTPYELWKQLDEQCLSAGKSCDVISIPHNSNLSNGRLFDRGWANALPDPQTAWALRAAVEPIVEMFQHKGQSECRNGFGDADDPECVFEMLRPPEDALCGNQVGSGGMRLWGCVHALDYVRNVLKEGLILEQELGENPYRLGFIGSTDTHNGTPGLVQGVDFMGHVGIVDDTPVKRLGEGNITHDAFLNNPGGLAGVYAVENSRDAVFEAIRRKETFATSGPRIEVRMFGGKELPDDLCGREDGVEVAASEGVPMGSSLVAPSSGAFRLMVQALADAGSEKYPGLNLDKIQIIKGWIDDLGITHEEVTDVLEGEGSLLDPATCDASGGSDSLCAVWEDPSFDPSVSAFYYARVLEIPSCRWSARECLAFEATERPENCDDPSHQAVVQQRAWTSPIWVEPN